MAETTTSAAAAPQARHAEASLPSEETIRRKMHQAGYGLRRVAKCVPKKSCPRRTLSSSG